MERREQLQRGPARGADLLFLIKVPTTLDGKDILGNSLLLSMG